MSDAHSIEQAQVIRVHSLKTRFPEKVLEQGFTPVPNAFLNCYASLGIVSGEAVFLMHLMFFQRSAKNPYPSFGRIAVKMGVSDHQVRAYARSLEKKGYIKRLTRQGRSNEFDLSPLYSEIARLSALKKDATTNNT